jgi:hypothetical protein
MMTVDRLSLSSWQTICDPLSRWPGNMEGRTSKGCRNKFDYDPDSSLFILGGLLPEGMMFPFDFGFIPSALGDDGVGRVIVAHPALWVFNARPHRFYLTERGRDKSLR